MTGELHDGGLGSLSGVRGRVDLGTDSIDRSVVANRYEMLVVFEYLPCLINNFLTVLVIDGRAIGS